MMGNRKRQSLLSRSLQPRGTQALTKQEVHVNLHVRDAMKEWGKGKGIKDQRSDAGKSRGEVTFIWKLERWKERKQAQEEGMFPAGGSVVRLGKGVQAQAKVLQVE